MTLLPWKRTAQDKGARAAGFEELAAPLLPALHNLAMWLARNSSDAEDLVQETYLKGLRGYGGFDAGTNFKAWMFRIMRNTYLTSRTGLVARRTVALEDELGEAEVHPEGAIERETPESVLMKMSDRAAVEAAMEGLPAPLLEVILLCDVEEMKYREIATVLEIPMGTVMSRVARARAALRAALGSEGGGSLARGVQG